jgi:hypothetical protein
MQCANRYFVALFYGVVITGRRVNLASNVPAIVKVECVSRQVIHIDLKVIARAVGNAHFTAVWAEIQTIDRQGLAQCR